MSGHQRLIHDCAWRSAGRLCKLFDNALLTESERRAAFDSMYEGLKPVLQDFLARVRQQERTLFPGEGR